MPKPKRTRKPKTLKAQIAALRAEHQQLGGRVEVLEHIGRIASRAWTAIPSKETVVAQELYQALRDGGFLQPPEPVPGIMGTAFWAEVKPYLRLELYARDTKAKDPRIRIEMHKMPPELWARALAFTMPCVCCDAVIHPFRERHDRASSRQQHIYYAPSCPLTENIGCSRGEDARDEYVRIRTELGDGPTSPPTTQMRFPSFR